MNAQVVAAESRLNGWAPPFFGAASGDPCAFNEHAQVMAAESRLNGWAPPFFGAASGGPCAFRGVFLEEGICRCPGTAKSI
jgi:hypothetical protein